ncbi:stability determinant [Sphingomonas gilva]|uniref:Stability determinant n=1 Tax=Sphingomonas gilva TaxID=2305907 RepID=A0A396RLF3_9SPHN|nr:stability determinant [Sphingomonas gilva]RHW16406.1 stability determinant [Sphingomonas gilva]
MGKLSPIVSEFETEEDAAAYDAWFRAQVEAALASTEPSIPHEEVMARFKARFPGLGDVEADLES